MRAIELPFPPDVLAKGISAGANTVIRWRSLADYSTAMQTAKRRGFGDSNQAGNWSGTTSLQEYIDMLDIGWPEGVQGVQGLDGISTDAAPKLGFVRDVGGAFPIIPRYLAGLPDCMLRPVELPNDAARGLTLIINASYNCRVKSLTAILYAQSVMRLVAWLQAEQVDVSVYCVVPSILQNKRYLYITNIRESGEVFRPERIAAILHTSFLRRGWFALLEHEHYELKLPGAYVATTSYGSCYEAKADEIQAVLPGAFSVIMLPVVGRGDPETAVKEAIILKLRGTVI